jgi:CRISPR-associated endoribonuclease Cas6
VKSLKTSPVVYLRYVFEKKTNYDQQRGDKLRRTGPISFYLSSPQEKFIQQFAKTLLKSPQVTLSRNSFIISGIEILPQKRLHLGYRCLNITIRAKDAKSKSQFK